MPATCDEDAAAAAAEVSPGIGSLSGSEVEVLERRRGGVGVVVILERVMTEMSGLVSGEMMMGLMGATMTESGKSLGGFLVGRKVCCRREMASATQFCSELQCTRWKLCCWIKQNQR